MYENFFKKKNFYLEYWFNVQKKFNFYWQIAAVGIAVERGQPFLNGDFFGGIHFYINIPIGEIIACSNLYHPSRTIKSNGLFLV